MRDFSLVEAQQYKHKRQNKKRCTEIPQSFSKMQGNSVAVQKSTWGCETRVQPPAQGCNSAMLTWCLSRNTEQPPLFIKGLNSLAFLQDRSLFSGALLKSGWHTGSSQPGVAHNNLSMFLSPKSMANTATSPSFNSQFSALLTRPQNCFLYRRTHKATDGWLKA